MPIDNKAKKAISSVAKDKTKAIAKPKDNKGEFQAIRNYNSFVIGVHNYHRMATNISLDFSDIAC